MSNKFFFFKNLDEHFVLYFLGLRLCLKYKKRFQFKEPSEYSLNKVIRDKKIIVSLTSYPARINTTYKTIITLLNQKLKADEIILWLAKEDFINQENDLPTDLLNLKNFGLSIKWCDNLKSYKKLVPALLEYPNDIIITADDDVYYEEDFLESLYKAYLKNPKNIYVKRAVKLEFKNNTLKAISPRKYFYNHNKKPTFLNQLMGGSGCLYPPNSLYKDVLNIEQIKKLIPTHDDAYFWAMAVLNKTKIQIIDGFDKNLYFIEGTQNVGLIHKNKKNGEGISLGNAYKILFETYPELLEILSKESVFSENDLEVFVMTYNRVELLKESIDSILNQTKKVKITIVDNYSNDSTGTFVKELMEKHDNLSYIRHDKHYETCGYSINALKPYLNKQYSIFFHDDDIMHPQYIEYVLELLNKHNNIDVICTLLSTFTDKEQIVFKNFKEIKYRIFKNKHSFARNTYLGYCVDRTSICFPNIVYKTENVDNLFKDNIYGKLADKPAVIEAVKDGSVIQILEKDIFKYRIHKGQDTAISINGPFLEEIVNYNKYYQSLFENNLLSILIYDIFSIKTIKSFYNWGNLSAKYSFIKFLSIAYSQGAFRFQALFYYLLPLKPLIKFINFIFKNKSKKHLKRSGL